MNNYTIILQFIMNTCMHVKKMKLKNSLDLGMKQDKQTV